MLRKLLFRAKELLECFLVYVLFPLELILICNERVFEELPGIFVGELLLAGDYVLLLPLFIILFLAELNDILNVVEILDELVGFHRSDPFYLRGVVTPAENAHVDEFIIC